MNHSLIIEGSRKQLVNQLVYFDEEKIHFLDHYVPEHGRKRTTVQTLLSTYTSAVEEILSDFSLEALNSRAMIGSEITLQYVNDQSMDTFTIVFPHLADPIANTISFLSPIGQQLLLSRTHDTCELELPEGSESIKIIQIKYVNAGDC